MKIKPGDILKYKMEPGNPMRIIDLVISLEGNKYNVVPLGYVFPGEAPCFWENLEAYHIATVTILEITGKTKIKVFPKLKYDIIKGLFTE